MKKISLLFMVFLLVLQSMILPVSANLSDTVNASTPTEITVITDGDKETVPVYEEKSESSKIIFELETEEKVTVLESTNDFYLAEFFNQEQNELQQGYISVANISKDLDEGLLDSPEGIDNSPIETTVITNDDEETVPVYEEKSESSTILFELANEDKVIVLESDEDFSFVEFFNREREELQQGFIPTVNILADPSSEEPVLEEPNSSDTIDDKNTSEEAEIEEPHEVNEDSESDLTESNEELEEGSNENTLEETTKEDDANEEQKDASVQSKEAEQNTTSLQNETVFSGIALNSQTHVFASTSTNSSILKSYAQGSILQYRSYSGNWYIANVWVNGVKKTGYIHKSHVENSNVGSSVLKGIALKSPTRIYSRASTSSSTLKSYSNGSILQYREYSSNWYVANVWVNGVKKTGYIHKSHVENSNVGSSVLKGIALKSPTRIYSRASTSSSALKSYSYGSILQYRTYSSEWYVANVWVNGVKKTGYIHKSHVENSNEGSSVLKGVASKSPTHVYSRASTSSSALKSYSYGSILQYRAYSSDWYVANVWVNGVKKTGYIHKSHVENINDKQESLEGWALKSPTNVYSKASRSSSVLKSYPSNRLLKFKTFSNSWYEATVYINGKAHTGYIHKSDIGFGSSETNYNLSLTEAVNIQMKANPQTDKNYAYVSKAYINSNNKVTAGSLNVRVGPGTGYATIGQLSNGTSVNILGEYNGWYQIAYNHTVWVSASPKDVRYYLDPNNFLNDQRQQFQFLDLAKPSAIDAERLNRLLADKGTLKGQGQAFIDASNKVGVNDVYLVSHALLETGNGMSNLATGVEVGKNKSGSLELVTSSNRNRLSAIKTTYNMYGIGAVDGNALQGGAFYAYNQDWTTPYKAIVGGASFIGVNYVQSGQNTLYKMRWNPAAMASSRGAAHQYATDIGWASKQVDTMYNLYQQLGITNVLLDIPVYKN